MKTTTQYLVLAGLVTFTLGAQARGLGPDEALKLCDSGTIQSFEKFNELALAQHPGGVDFQHFGEFRESNASSWTFYINSGLIF